MTHRILITALSLSLGLLAGCERDREETTVTTTPPATTTTPAQQQQPPATSQYQPTRQTDTTTTTTTTTGMAQPDTSGMQAHKATGTITVVDSNSRTVTIEHEPVASLNWPAMTMTFEVQDASQLQNLEAGDQIQFAFVDAGNNRYLIREINEQPGDRLSQQQDDND